MAVVHSERVKCESCGAELFITYDEGRHKGDAPDEMEEQKVHCPDCKAESKVETPKGATVSVRTAKQVAEAMRPVAPPTFHHGDLVEEVETKRRGIMWEAPRIPTDTLRWRVDFSDGKPDPVKYYLDVTKIRLISCPHNKAQDPGIVPERGIMG